VPRGSSHPLAKPTERQLHHRAVGAVLRIGNSGSTRRSAPQQKNPRPGFLAAKGGPTRSSPVMGDVMIRRPCVAAGLAGSDWRTRRPSRLSITTLRRLTT